MADPIVVWLHGTTGRLERVSWCPTAEAAKAAIDEAPAEHVHARVEWPDGSWRVLSRSVVGGPWIPGPRVRPENEAMRESA